MGGAAHGERGRNCIGALASALLKEVRGAAHGLEGEGAADPTLLFFLEVVFLVVVFFCHILVLRRCILLSLEVFDRLAVLV